MEEVTSVCVAFHPHTDIRLFPQDSEAVLFWRARSTGDWVITRIATAPNPEGLRTALEYTSVVLSDDQLARLHYNPFRALDAGLHTEVRDHFLAGNFEPVPFDIPPVASSNGTGTAKPAVANGAPATPQNVQALRDFVAHHEDGPPPTFATWWSSGGQIPHGYFDIVLRAASSEPMSLRDAAEAASGLAAETKASLPAPPASDAVAADLVRSVAAAADAVIESVGEAGTRLNTEGPDLFRARMEDAARQATKAANDLASLRRRIVGADTSLSEPASVGVLTTLAARYETLAQELPKVRHPNPFANRTAPPPVDTRPVRPRTPETNTTAKPSGGVSPALYAIPAVAIAAFAVWRMGAAGKPNTKPTPAPKPTATVAAVRPATPVPAPAFAELQKAQDSVASDASQRAKEDARDAVGSSGKTPPPASLEKITMAAIRAAYQGKVSDAEYQKAFGGDPWPYTKYQETLPILTSKVHDAAVQSAAEAQIKATKQAASQATEDVKRQAAQLAAQQKQSDAQRQAEDERRRREQDQERQQESRRQERQSRAERNRPTPEPKPRERATPKPRSTPKPSSEGRAAETGL